MIDTGRSGRGTVFAKAVGIVDDAAACTEDADADGGGDKRNEGDIHAPRVKSSHTPRKWIRSYACASAIWQITEMDAVTTNTILNISQP